MAARHDAGLNAFGDPGAYDEVADLSFNPDQIACVPANNSTAPK
jgi:hypothetical protein